MFSHDKYALHYFATYERKEGRKENNCKEQGYELVDPWINERYEFTGGGNIHP